MKKLLISTLSLIIIILTGITVIKGLQIGNLKILGISDIKSENEKLDETIKQATKLASTDYSQKIDSLNTKIKQLNSEKSNYDELVNVSTDSEINAASQNLGYDIDYLWIRIGNHAKSEGITMDVSAKNMTLVTTDSNVIQADKKYTCNLNFTVTGAYAGIAGFIEDIEDDSQLGFRIDDFNMLASSEGTNILQATFNCKNVVIKGVSTNSASENTDTSTTNGTETTNTTNTTVNNTVQ